MVTRDPTQLLLFDEWGAKDVVGLLIGIVSGVHIHIHFFDDTTVERIDEDLFRTFTDQIIKFEGGWKYGSGTYAGIGKSAHPDSPLWGYDLSGSPSEKVKKEVYRIYMQQYYKRMRIHDLPQEVGFLIYDFGINAGPHEAIKEARLAIFSYIEGWYNPHRRHSSIAYYAPIAYEKLHQSQA